MAKTEIRKLIDRWLLRVSGHGLRIVAASERTRSYVRGEIVAARNQRTAAARRRLYVKIVEAFAELGEYADGELREVVEETAPLVEAQIAAGSGGGLEVKFSPERVEEIWESISPARGASLAATMTDNMAENTISALRRALVEVSRRAAVEGGTARDIERAIKERWAELAGDDRNFEFVDRAGRHWNTDTYINMLTRTTAQRAYNEALLQSLVEEGFNYVRLNTFGDTACETCKEWDGRVLRIVDAGAHRELPTVEDAQEAGVFHPNCVCVLTYVDEDDLGPEPEVYTDEAECSKALRERAQEIYDSGESKHGAIVYDNISKETVEAVRQYMPYTIPDHLVARISDDNILHGFINHGVRAQGKHYGRKVSKNRRGVDADAISKIPLVLNTPDAVLNGKDHTRKNSDGTVVVSHAVKFQKQFGTEQMIVVFRCLKEGVLDNLTIYFK